MSGAPSGEDVIFEITRVGDIQRIAAVHVATGTEVVVQAPASAALADARALALRKLQRVLADADTSQSRPKTGQTGKFI